MRNFKLAYFSGMRDPAAWHDSWIRVLRWRSAVLLPSKLLAMNSLVFFPPNKSSAALDFDVEAFGSVIRRNDVCRLPAYLDLYIWCLMRVWRTFIINYTARSMHQRDNIESEKNPVAKSLYKPKDVRGLLHIVLNGRCPNGSKKWQTKCEHNAVNKYFAHFPGSISIWKVSI